MSNSWKRQKTKLHLEDPTPGGRQRSYCGLRRFELWRNGEAITKLPEFKAVYTADALGGKHSGYRFQCCQACAEHVDVQIELLKKINL